MCMAVALVPCTEQHCCPFLTSFSSSSMRFTIIFFVGTCRIVNQPHGTWVSIDPCPPHSTKLLTPLRLLLSLPTRLRKCRETRSMDSVAILELAEPLLANSKGSLGDEGKNIYIKKNNNNKTDHPSSTLLPSHPSPHRSQRCTRVHGRSVAFYVHWVFSCCRGLRSVSPYMYIQYWNPRSATALLSRPLPFSSSSSSSCSSSSFTIVPTLPAQHDLFLY